MNQHSPSASLGFLMGCLGGLALSMGVVGLVVGMSIGGGMNSLAQYGAQPEVAALPPTAPTAPEPPPAGPVPPVDPKTDHIRGNPNAKISIIEYSDFECPFCKRHHPTMVELMTKYGNDVNWVLRHYPLSFHPSAQKSAEASECAAELGGNDAFWKFADALFALPQLTVDQLVPTAKSIGLDEAKFKACLDSGRHNAKITEQMNGGSQAGVSGTPGNIILNNKTETTQLISGAVPLTSFTSVIDGMLK